MDLDALAKLLLKEWEFQSTANRNTKQLAQLLEYGYDAYQRKRKICEVKPPPLLKIPA